MSSPSEAPKIGSKAGTPAKLRKGSGSSTSQPFSVAESAKPSKNPAKKLTPKAPQPINDDEQSIPETPSPKSKKASSEQRRPKSPPEDAVSQASGSASALGGFANKAKDSAGKAQESVKQGVQSTENNVPSVPFDLAALKGLVVSDGGQVLGQEGNPVGQVVEGNPEDLLGQTIGDDGEILDEDGDLIGRVDILHDVAEQAQKLPEDAQSQAGGLKDVVTDLSQLQGLPVSDGGVIKNAAGQVVGKITDGDPEDLIDYTLNDDGEVVDDDGDAIGRVELVPVEEQKKAIEEAAGGATERVNSAKEDAEDTLEDAEDNLDVNKVKTAANGAVGEAGDAVDKAQEGVPDADTDDVKETVEGAVDDAQDTTEGVADDAIDDAQDTDGGITDDARDVAEDAPEDAQERIPDLDTLEGMTCNKRGWVIDKTTGKPVGELIEGDAKKISRLGATLDDKGQFWDNRGNVLGKVKALPIEDDKDEEGPFAGLEGLVLGQDGWVEDENGTRVGQLVEGDAKKLLGRSVDEDGEITDKYGNVIGRADRYEEPEVEPEEEAGHDLSVLNGLTCNKAGYVIGSEGYPIARVVEGNPRELAGKKIEDGEIYDGKKVVGRVELIPEDERESKPEGPFAGMEYLFVNKDGFVEDDEGSIVGKLVEGDAKKLRGRAVDEDGEITDKYGNVKGRAEPYEPPEEEAPAEIDLSILEGKVVNKSGNVVDPATGAVFGRIVGGDKRLAGRKVDAKGQIWGDNGQIIGRAELIPGAEEEKAEGPFYRFDNAEVGKNGLVLAGGQIIGRLIEGDAKRLVGRNVDEDGDVSDKNGNTIGKAERWEPEEKQRDVNPMSGLKVNKEGEVRDADGNLIGKLTEGNLAILVGKTIDDNGYVVDNDGNKIGECTLLENIPEPEPEEEEKEGPTAEEQEAAAKAEQDRKLAERMCHILRQTLDQVKPICKMIQEVSHPRGPSRTSLT